MKRILMMTIALAMMASLAFGAGTTKYEAASRTADAVTLYGTSDGGDTLIPIKTTVDGTVVTDLAGWDDGNVTFVPVGSSLEAYAAAATAGDTLILGSGTYTTDGASGGPTAGGVICNKNLNFIGQGVGKTIVTRTVTGWVTVEPVFNVSSGTTRISNLTISCDTSAAPIAGVKSRFGTTQVRLEDVSISVSETGSLGAYGVLVENTSSVRMRDTTIDVTSSGGYCYGMLLENNSTTTMIASLGNVGVTSDATSSNSHGYYIRNNNVANTISAVLYDCYAISSAGSTGDCGLEVISTTTNNARAYVYGGSFSGQDYDVLQTGTNTVELHNVELVNNTTSGTITYGGTAVSSKVHANGVVTSTNFKKCMTVGALTIWISDGTTAEGALTGVEGDICLNGGTGAGQAAYCDAAGTNWTDI